MGGLPWTSAYDEGIYETGKYDMLREFTSTMLPHQGVLFMFKLIHLYQILGYWTETGVAGRDSPTLLPAKGCRRQYDSLSLSLSILLLFNGWLIYLWNLYAIAAVSKKMPRGEGRASWGSDTRRACVYTAYLSGKKS